VVSICRSRRNAAALLAASLAVLLIPGWSSTPAHAQAGDLCLAADPPPVEAPSHRLRFGTTPLAAGSILPTTLVPEDPAAGLAAVQRLRPGRRQLVMRLNRMFMADGEAGIRRFAAIVDRYAAAGIDSELQVRYHPGPGQEGDMAAWERFVRRAASILGKRPSVKALTITNEGNFTATPNTSDGSYPGIRQAIVTGMVAARDQLDRMGRPDVELGFSFAWRWLPESDAAFWQELGVIGTPAFRRAVDYVGLQVYPHLVVPPAPLPGRSAGDEVIEALTLLRSCYMPKAGLGPGVELWVTENGYVTNLGRTEGSQDAALATTLEAVHRYSGTLGITDYRWFNLRDNNTTGPDLFDAVGLLRDDYSEKPAFARFRSAIEHLGTDRPPRLKCRGRIATLVGTPKADRIKGSIGPDVIATRGGRDTIVAAAGDDVVCSGKGPDRIRTGRGADKVLGQQGRDRIRGGPGPDLLLGGPGRDRIAGGPGRDRCPGGREAAARC
jgi:RTX calcium-binding nonapeptide repeat (4 copies)